MKLNHEHLQIDDIVRLAMAATHLEIATLASVKKAIFSRIDEINDAAGMAKEQLKGSPGFEPTEYRNDAAKVRRVTYSFRGHVVLEAVETKEQFTLVFRHGRTT